MLVELRPPRRANEYVYLCTAPEQAESCAIGVKLENNCPVINGSPHEWLAE
jgi:hypothetical protein